MHSRIPRIAEAAPRQLLQSLSLRHAAALQPLPNNLRHLSVSQRDHPLFHRVLTQAVSAHPFPHRAHTLVVRPHPLVQHH